MEVRLPGRRTVVTRPYPDSDPAFAAEVATALKECRASTTDADELRAAVTARLRQTYPNTLVVARQPMASMFAGEELWYVYRDRALRGPSEQRDRLYQALAAARRTRAASRSALDESAAARERMRSGPERPEGLRWRREPEAQLSLDEAAPAPASEAPRVSTSLPTDDPGA